MNLEEPVEEPEARVAAPAEELEAGAFAIPENITLTIKLDLSDLVKLFGGMK